MNQMLGAVFLPTAFLFTFLLGAQVKEVRVPLSPRWTRRLIILGALFDVASTLLPWGFSVHAYVFLPWSPLWGQASYALPFTYPFITISIVIRAAAVIGWAGVILYEYFKGRVVPYGAILVSGALSFVAFLLFAQIPLGLSWGAYLALAGGIFKVSGVLMEKLEVEVVLEREAGDQES